jgi:hypothetical protein
MTSVIINAEQVKLFYQYLTPSASSYLIFDQNSKLYSAEQLTFTPTVESFIAITKENNETLQADCFSCRNRFHTQRIEQNITFLKCWLIDIDNDFDDSKSKSFEDLCAKYNLFIEAKVKSRAVGGYHYYLAYKPTDVTDANRASVKQIGLSLRAWLLANNIDIDKRIFDLSRLIRIWGTYNYKQQSMCELVYLNLANAQQIDDNTAFINSLVNVQEQQMQDTTSNLKTSCELIEYVRTNKLEKQNTSKNDKLIKNLAIYLWQIYGDAGLQLGREITKFQMHNPAEFDGWFAKAKLNKIMNFGCGELNLWLKEHYPEVLANTCSKCRFLNKNKIEYVNSNETYHQLKQIMRQREKLIINRELFIKGIITPSDFLYKQEIVLWRKYEIAAEPNGEVLPPLIVFFDEKLPQQYRNRAREIQVFTVDLYLYKLVEQGTEYAMLSEHPLEFGEHYIDGTAIKIADNLKIGQDKNSKISSKQKIIICHSARALITKINTVQELYDKFNGTSPDDVMDYIMSKDNKVYIQPEYFTTLLWCFFFSSKNEDYPLHLCVVGKKFSGKSTVQKIMFKKFNEPVTFIDGSNSTLKGLVPSFTGKIPEIGMLMRCKRLCVIDEFFKMLKSEEDHSKIGMLNNALTHTVASNTSGRGSITIGVHCKVLANTNPLYGKTFEESINALPDNFVDRVLMYKQDELHYKWVRSGKHIKTNYKSKISSYDLLAIYDFFNSFTCNMDLDKLYSIVEASKPLVPYFMLELYATRYGVHHPVCLLDGIVKKRCYQNKLQDFTAIDQDYKEFEKLWQMIIINWYDSYTTAEQERLISQEQKEFVALVKANEGVWDYQFENICTEHNIEYKYNITHLMKLNLVDVVERKIFLNKEAKEIKPFDFTKK